ncbi:MAG TPA: rod shape-determining protein MreD [Terracidiphilus sp.]|jgi:rod shape-determining protein MreD
MLLTANSRRDLDIHRYPAPLYVIAPTVALVLQALLPRFMGRFAYFDLPLIVTIYFALGRRSPIQGMFMGGFLGLFEDALTHRAIGINGIAKTIAGYLAASVGIRIDVQNTAIRLMLNFVLSLLCTAIDFFINRVLLGLDLHWNWLNMLFQAIGNSAIALVVFPLLDRFQQRD